MRFDPDKEQRKHLASLFDKAAISFMGVFGYNASTTKAWLHLTFFVVLFALMQMGILWFVKEKDDEAK